MFFLNGKLTKGQVSLKAANTLLKPVSHPARHAPSADVGLQVA